MRVPVIDHRNQLLALAIGYGAFCVLYLGSAALQLSKARLLAPTALDSAIPFVGWTVWIYLSQLALLPLSIILARDDAERSHSFYAMLMATLLAAAIFVGWPTELARQAWGTGGLTGLAWRLLYLCDTPANCFPSLHVTLACIAGGGLWRAGFRRAAVLWPGTIALATLTTKQHIAWDVIGGLALALTAWHLTSKLLQYERAQSVRHAGSA
jgi:hypothetical protein